MIRVIIYTFSILFYSCAEEQGLDISSINFGSNNSLDVITWNIENFPKNSETINYVSELINAFDDIDIIALQEISDQSAFNDLINSLNENNWVGFRNSSSNYGELSYLINTTNIEIIHPPYTILDYLIIMNIFLLMYI